ncbi:hypothetical protein AOQ84DRAFT_369362 [Glonium stellatum]|uniref:Rhodopsin domain-containing protein n=1 Tax=Glonium stellatum TaxID=574774 RepID=A0A8E2EPK4_9PEZI|nr:hypothetical protein AOQ84DRAFT_369362 [Glonium stellatum]
MRFNTDSTSLDIQENSLADIKIIPFKTTIALFFGFALISVAGRISFKTHARHKLALDDYILFFGCICSIAGTGLLYKECDNIFLWAAITKDSLLAQQFSHVQLHDIGITYKNYVQAISALGWTTVFAVKFSYLSFFTQLTRAVPRIRHYHWTITAITLVSWILALVQTWIIYFRKPDVVDGAKYQVLVVSLNGPNTSLDIVTDLLILSIPLLILRRARIDIKQKIAVGTFFSFSLLMVVMAIIRLLEKPNSSAIIWKIFWLILEGDIAILMACLTAYRTIFVLYKEKKRSDERLKRHSYSLRGFRQNQPDTDGEPSLLEVPPSALSDMRSCIRRTNHTEEVITSSSMDHGVWDGFSEEPSLIGFANNHHLPMKPAQSYSPTPTV